MPLPFEPSRLAIWSAACLLCMSVSAVRIWQIAPHRMTDSKTAAHNSVDPEGAQELKVAYEVSVPAEFWKREEVRCTSSLRRQRMSPASLIPNHERGFDIAIPSCIQESQFASIFVAGAEAEESEPPVNSLGSTLVNAEQLNERLELLTDPEIDDWKSQVRQQVSALNQAGDWSSTSAGIAIRRLRDLHSEQTIRPLLERVSDPVQDSRLGMAAYAVERRAGVWLGIHLATQRNVVNRVKAEQAHCQRNNILKVINDVEKLFPDSPSGNNWRTFLGMTAVRETVVQNDVDQELKRVGLAAEALRQINAAELTAEQNRYFQHPAVKSYLHLLHRIVTHPSAVQGLANCLEGVERDPSQVTGGCLARYWQQLRFATVPEYQQIAQAIDTHYRNANMRLCVTNEFLNRFLPAIEHVRSPVRENILGADVTGQSEALNKLRVRLVPDPDEVKLKLEVAGVMDSNTRSTHGGIVMFNQNRSRYIVSKLFAFDTAGMHVGATRADAEAATSLRGMTTKYDALPLVGPMFRRVARQRHQESKPLTQRIIGDRVASKVKRITDAKLEEQIVQARQRLEQSVVQPLQEMDLQPEALAMQTTEDRVVIRGRLAGGDQIAAFTTRPRAISENLCSIQVHESAVNNLIDRLGLNGRTVEVRALFRELLDQWDMQNTPVPEEIPEDVELTMAEERPVSIRCQDDRLLFSMRVKRLKSPRGQWGNFEVLAAFAPQTDGFRCDLVRDGSLEISSIGSRPLSGKNRIAISAIFTKVFSKNQKLKLINEELSNDPRLANLDLDQVVIRDGWVGVSVAETTPPLTVTRNPSHRR